MTQIRLIKYSQNSEGAILCPICSYDYTHQQAVEVFERPEDAKSGTHVKILDDDIQIDRNLTGNPSPRRQGVTLDMICESKHSFKLHIYQHKGQTFIETEHQ